jgi:hypothetical protein
MRCCLNKHDCIDQNEWLLGERCADWSIPQSAQPCAKVVNDAGKIFRAKLVSLKKSIDINFSVLFCYLHSLRGVKFVCISSPSFRMTTCKKITFKHAYPILAVIGNLLIRTFSTPRNYISYDFIISLFIASPFLFAAAAGIVQLLLNSSKKAPIILLLYGGFSTGIYIFLWYVVSFTIYYLGITHLYQKNYFQPENVEQIVFSSLSLTVVEIWTFGFFYFMFNAFLIVLTFNSSSKN